MSNQHGKPLRVLLLIRSAIVVGILFVVVGIGGLLFGARQKLKAIDCLSGASPQSHWEYEQRGSEWMRSLLGEQGTLMFLDSPRKLTFGDVFSADQARALDDLPTLRQVDIAYIPSDLMGELQGLSHLERLTIGSDLPVDEIDELQASLSNCEVIYRYWNGSVWWESPRVATISESD